MVDNKVIAGIIPAQIDCKQCGIKTNDRQFIHYKEGKDVIFPNRFAKCKCGAKYDRMIH